MNCFLLSFLYGHRIVEVRIMKSFDNLKFKCVCAAIASVAISMVNLGTADAITSRTCSLFAGELDSYTLGLSTSHFDESSLINRKHVWMVIPSWLAGTWQATSELVLQVFDYRQQSEVLGSPVKLSIQRTSVIGMQSDKFGRLWHCVGVPYTRTIDVGPYIERHEMVSVVPNECSESRVVVTCVSFVSRIDRRNGELVSVFKEHTVTTYAPIREGLIQVTFIINDYDMRSKPIFWSKKVCTEKRIKPFRVIDYDNERGELKLSFRRFLLEQRMADAMPLK